MAGVNGYATVTVVDNGGAAILVPGQALQLVIGCSSAGTVGQLIATRSPTTLNNTFGFGPLPEASGLTCLGGGTVLAIRATTTTAGTASAVNFTGSGTSVVTVTGAPTDTSYVRVRVITGGTIAVAGIILAVSYDAGRTESPPISLGTANSYALPGLGATLNFAAGTLVAGDLAKFGTVEPQWNAAGILAALTAYATGPYATQPLGSVHIVGGSTAGGVPGADATTIAGYLEGAVVGATNLANPLYNAAIMSARDASPPSAYGGTGETEATWMAAVITSYSAVAAKRERAAGGFYNMPSALTNSLGMSPRYRRALGWAIAQRKVQIQPQRSVGRVKDGPLACIVVDPVNDPLDGFIYHNEANFAPAGLGDQRFCAATTRAGSQAFFVRTDLTMAAVGSQYAQGPLMDVANVASNIVQQVTTQLVNDNVRLLTSGTLDPRDAANISAGVLATINSLMTSQQMISSATVVVDTTTNVFTTGLLIITTTLVARGIVLQVNSTIQYSNPNQAQAA